MAERGFTYVGKLLSNLIKLIPIDFENLKRFWGFEDELNQLQQSLVSIADLVEDAEEKQQTLADVRGWLRNLKEVAYEADDLLSELAYETTRFQIQNQEVHSFSSISRAIDNVRKTKFLGQMVPKLKKVNQSLQTIGSGLMVHLEIVNQSLQTILRDGLSLGLSSIPHNLESIMFQTPAINNSVVGRKADAVKIVNLITSSCYQQLTVVSIIGGEGVGKTTLAKLVCQRVMALTRKPFDVTIWLCVFDNLSVHKILGGMLQSLNASKGDLTSQDAILQQLKEELVGKKFLLVLDNVWDADPRQWDLLKTLLSRICTNNGNAILVITCFENVASSIGISSQHSYQLNSLSNDECWFILKEKAFRNATSPVPSNLIDIGREIAKLCRGIPLIAKVSGGIMGFNRDEEAWSKIRNSYTWIEMKNQDYFAKVEQFFHHLPSYLKPCLVFCSKFPKDFLFRKEELIWLWIAEGIVESCDMGNKCFDALFASSLFQDAEMDDYDDVILCKMNDLVHDSLLYLCAPETSSINYLYTDYQHVADSMNALKGGAKRLRTLIVVGAPNEEIWKVKRLWSLYLNVADMEVLPSAIGEMNDLRYLDVSITKTKELSESITKLYNLRTLNLSNSSIKGLPEFITKLFNLQTLNLSNSNINELPESIVKLHSLETSNLSNSNIKELPKSISKLHNLQTLDVSNSDIKELRDSITELCNLQTLKFLECKELTKLPRRKINNLISLKHISFSYENPMPFGLGKLNGLETLLFFVVDPNWGGSMEELQFLNKLRGNLKITRLEEVCDKEEVARANLQGKAEIQGLVFQWSYGANHRSLRDEELLEGLQPHPNIERIKVKYYMGVKWPSWMFRMKSPGNGNSFGVINNLVDLTLEWCCNCVQLPCLGDLPHLKFLKMNHMGKVKRIDNDFYGIDIKGSSIGCLRLFPALQSLSISWMDNLTEWSFPSYGNNVVVFPCLENLSIQSCSKLTGFPMSDLSELVKLEIRDCEELRLLTDKQQSFASLTSLSIAGCSKVTYLRNWLQSDECFMELSVTRCEWMMFIPEDLGKNLSIGAFSEDLDDFRYLNGIKDLPCLEVLEIWGSDFFGREMCSIPKQLQHLTVLKSLKIMGFTTMEALPEWFTNLQSLQYLSLDDCRHIEFPSTAVIIQRLSSLTRLSLNCCPILTESISEWLLCLISTGIKVEFSPVSKVRVRLGY
ncbi:putative disease resistance protein RGA3 [Euphorbia lathyris]|uniref:putative disease resistance protein RGA3 n=1 Tax=Euphorbia lathyris TaxID=212925 RepID=UPI0033131F2B